MLVMFGRVSENHNYIRLEQEKGEGGLKKLVKSAVDSKNGEK